MLISDDSDLEPAIAWIHKKFPKLPITIYIPKLPGDFDVRRYDFYKGIGVNCESLPTNRLATFQFPTSVKLETAKLYNVPKNGRSLLPDFKLGHYPCGSGKPINDRSTDHLASWP